MGTVALAIGTAPLGTLMAGYLAETIGAQRAIFTLSISGLLVFGLLSRWAWKLRTETS
jgi:hypothetical protein